MGEKQELEFEVLSKLYQASVETLQGILRNKIITEPDKADKVLAVKAILTWLDKEDAGEDGNPTALLLLNDALIAKKITVKTEKAPEPKPSDAKNKHPPLCHKDFKISGEISDRPNRLSFVSLVRQFEAGLRKSYSEADIVYGVTRAISPTLHLRSYLEGREHLSLSSLRKILRSEEKSATELYTHLTNSTQGKDEPQDFLLKLLSLKQKIMFVSKEEGAEVHYDERLVTSVLLHTQYIGINDETLRREVKPILDSKVEDKLIQQFSTIVARERERKGRITKAKVSTVTEEVQNSPKKEQKQKEVREGFLWTEVQELRAEIAEIKKQNSLPLKSSSNTDAPRRFQLGCEKCRQLNTASSCTHCWICGSEEHIKAGCKQRKRSGNGRGSRRGDRQ